LGEERKGLGLGFREGGGGYVNGFFEGEGDEEEGEYRESCWR
jgi:hypothetical protein